MYIRRNTTLSSQELVQLLAAGQSEQIAFLPEKSSIRSVAETLIALANSHGGFVVMGVNKRGVAQGQFDAKRATEMAVDASLHTEPPLILPSPQTITIGSEQFGTGNLVLISVPAGLPHIYSVQGKYLTRAGKSNRPLGSHELRRLLVDRGESGFEATVDPVAGLDDLNPSQIERYMQQIAAAPDSDPMQLLISKGCIGTDMPLTNENTSPTRPTVAGLLLFGRDPQRFVRSAEIICVRYAGESMSDEFVRQDISGILSEQIRQAEAFVASNMRRGMTISGLSRQETTEYPIAVVREAIVNAIAHRDYSVRGEGIRILMFSDRMEIYSPGRLPGHVTLDNLISERFSRNEAIVAVLTDLGYIERLGYGIDRMIATMNDQGLPAPLFEETAAGFLVTLKSMGADLVSTQPAQKPWNSMGLNPRQQKAISYVQEYGRITNSDYLALIPEVSAETIRRDLADLVDKNLLIRIGNKKATYYILK